MIREFSSRNVRLEFWNPTDSRVTDKGRKVDFFDPCSCGCDTKENPDLLGYLSGSNDDGNGFTLSIYDQETYDEFCKIFPIPVQTLIDRHIN